MLKDKNDNDPPLSPTHHLPPHQTGDEVAA